MNSSTDRLAYLVSQYPTVHHTFILREIRQLRELGVDVDVYSVSDADRDAEDMTPVEVEELQRTRYIKRVGIRGAFKAHLATFLNRPVRYVKELCHNTFSHGLNLREAINSILYFVEAVIVGRWLEQTGVKRVHSHFSSNVALPVARLFDVDISLTIHGPAEHNDPIAFRMAEKVAVSSQIIATSFYARSQIMRHAAAEYWSKIKVIYLGVDTEEFTPRTPPTNETTDVICVGRLAGVKSQRTLIAAMSQLIDADYDVQLRLVGDGVDRPALETLAEDLGISDRVIFEGWLNQDQVQDRLRKADIFALASFAEGMPVVLMEAMSMEIPCVSTTVHGIPELIRDGVDGMIVPPSDAGGFATAVARLMDSDTLRARVGKAARKRILEKCHLLNNCMSLGVALLGMKQPIRTETPAVQPSVPVMQGDVPFVVETGDGLTDH